MNRRPVVVCGAMVVLVLTGACTSDPREGLDLQTPPAASTPTAQEPGESPTPSPSPTETVSAQEQEILDQYRGFYKALDQARREPERASEILAPYAAGEQLEQASSSILGAAMAGQEPYGEVVLHPEVARIDGDTAVVEDCQDTSGSGLTQNGRPVTVGYEEDSVLTTLIRGEDNQWRVVATEYPDDRNRFCR
jgi:hypothetical protein